MSLYFLHTVWNSTCVYIIVQDHGAVQRFYVVQVYMQGGSQDARVWVFDWAPPWGMTYRKGLDYESCLWWMKVVHFQSWEEYGCAHTAGSRVSGFMIESWFFCAIQTKAVGSHTHACVCIITHRYIALRIA